jgi:hypothetical protein
MAIVDVERLGKFSGTGAEATDILSAAPLLHDRQAAPRLEGANQNQPGAFAAFHENIQHPMDAIIKINVDRPSLVAFDERAGARAREGVTRLIVQSQIGFGLDNDPGAFSPNQFRADELTCADQWIALKK